MGDIFLRSLHVADKEFIRKLARGGNAYIVRRIDIGSYIEVGRFGYRVNEPNQGAAG